jgi:uncharacterized protein YegJ (DUF2314 family)
MNQAMERARAEVQEFVAHLMKPADGESDFAVKVPITEAGDTEHFWLEGVRYQDGKLSGRLANDPEVVRNHHYGEQVSVASDQISDWMYLREKRLVGGFTIRVLRNRMPAAERLRFDQSLQFKID